MHGASILETGKVHLALLNYKARGNASQTNYCSWGTQLFLQPPHAVLYPQDPRLSGQGHLTDGGLAT